MAQNWKPQKEQFIFFYKIQKLYNPEILIILILRTHEHFIISTLFLLAYKTLAKVPAG